MIQGASDSDAPFLCYVHLVFYFATIVVMEMSKRKNWPGTAFGLILFTLVLLTLTFSYYKYYVKTDFIAYGVTACDPELYTCFVTECMEDDPRCSETSIDGLYNFSLVRIDQGSSTELFCTDSAIEEYADYIGDASCSEETTIHDFGFDQ